MATHGSHCHGHRCSHGHPCTRGPREGGLAAAALLKIGRVPLLPMDSATVEQWRLLGMDPLSQEADVATTLSCVHYAIPSSPVSDQATLCALHPHDGVDRVSGLPDVLLRNIVSLLPVKDAARTAALSCRWRGIWFSAPLILVDTHLFPAGGGVSDDLQAALANARCVTSAVTRILTAHPGPFLSVRLVSSYMEEFPGLLAHWLQFLAVKGVRELILVNRPWPIALQLPATFFGMATLTRLYLGLYGFPDTSSLPRAVAFPNLRELGLCCMYIESRDMDFVLARSPVLEILCIQVNVMLRRLSLISRSLRCVQMVEGMDLDIIVEDAPRLERLIMWTSSARDGLRRRVKIGHAPSLTILGYLNPEWHVLEVGNTVIKGGTRASPSTIVPSVKILALRARLGVRNDAKMLPSFLRCFPNIERLHIESSKTIEPTRKLNIKFWQEAASAIECVQSHIKLMIFSGFRGERSELSFLKFFLESARELTKLVIVFSKGSFTSLTQASSKADHLFAAKSKWANQLCSVLLYESAFEEGDDKWLLNFERGSDFDTADPFAFAPALRGCI